MKQTMQPISIVIPTLNEADNLPLLFSRIHTSLSLAEIPYEILVVDDHSTDGTARVAEQADPRYNVQLLLKQGEPGKAFSLLEGFQAAKYELICMIDGDLQYPPEAIKQMYHKLQYCEADIVATQRVDNQTSLLRRTTSSTFNLVFTRLLFGIKYDTQSGLKLFRKSILKTMQLSPSPWTFDLEFIVRALEQGYVVVSQDIAFSERYAGTPKVRILSASKEIAGGSLRLWRSSSIKHVKHHYKLSEVLQQNYNWLVILLFSGILAFSIPLAQSSAQHENAAASVSHGQRPSRPNDRAEKADAPLAASPAAAATASSQSSDASSAPTEPTPAPAASSPSDTTAPALTPASISTSEPTPDTISSDTPTTTTAPVSTTVSQAKPTKPSSKTIAAANTAAKKPVYYPESHLGTSQTHRLLQLAGAIVIAGVVCILLGGLIYAIKSMARRPRRRHIPIHT